MRFRERRKLNKKEPGDGVCKWGTNRRVVIQQEITVDSCIADEIVELNRLGVRTEGSCCGHGKGFPAALITPSSAEKALKLGYEVTAGPCSRGGFCEIKLKSEGE